MELSLDPWPELPSWVHSSHRPLLQKQGLLLSPEPLLLSCALSALRPLVLLHSLCFLAPSSPLILSFHTSSWLITPLGLSFPFPVCFPSLGLAAEQRRENAQLSGTQKSLCTSLICAVGSQDFSRLSSQLSFKPLAHLPVGPSMLPDKENFFSAYPTLLQTPPGRPPLQAHQKPRPCFKLPVFHLCQWAIRMAAHNRAESDHGFHS